MAARPGDDDGWRPSALVRAVGPVLPSGMPIVLEALGRVLVPGVELTVEARNLTDRHVQDFGGYPLPGRAFFASLRYSRS